MVLQGVLTFKLVNVQSNIDLEPVLHVQRIGGEILQGEANYIYYGQDHDQSLKLA